MQALIQELKVAAYLLSEMTFGFELEALYRGIADPNDPVSVKRTLEERFAKEFGPGGEIKGDLTIHPSKQGDITFEYASPIMPFKPVKLLTFKKFLKNLSRRRIVTNNTCALHVHIAFPNMSENDMMWVMVNLAMDKDILQTLTKLDDYKFIHAEHASMALIGKLQRVFADTDWVSNPESWTKLDSYLTDEKTIIVRLHPQGTLEWRGPRDFLNDRNQKTINHFIAALYKWVMWVNRVIESRESIDKAITRKEFEAKLSRVGREKIYTPTMRPSRFSKDQDMEDAMKLLKQFPWLAKAKFKDALIFEEDGILYWVSGTWESGVWEDGDWQSGEFRNGTWLNGTWEDGVFTDSIWKDGFFTGGSFQNSEWFNGEFRGMEFSNSKWHDGKFRSGDFLLSSFFKGRVYGGEFIRSDFFSGVVVKGRFFNSRFHKGTWQDGDFLDHGEWYGGTFKDGTFKDSTFHDGIFESGDFIDSRFIEGKFTGRVLNTKRAVASLVNVEPNSTFHHSQLRVPTKAELQSVQHILAKLPFHADIYLLVGETAKNQYMLSPTNTMFLKPNACFNSDIVIHEFGHHVYHKKLKRKRKLLAQWKAMTDSLDHYITEDIENECFAQCFETVYGTRQRLPVTETVRDFILGLRE